MHGKLLGIQFCRGIAAILVVLYHAGRMLALPQYAGHVALRGVFNFGNAGVDFFFVLSGFIIFFVHGKDIGRPKSLPAYLWSRVTRIYPIYWFVTAIVLGLIVVGPGIKALDPGYVISSLLLLPQPREPVLSVGWTLVHEMLFYSVFAIAIVSRTLGLSVALVWLVLSAMRAFFTFDGVMGVLASPYHLQFALGVAAAFVVRRWPVPNPRWIAGAGLAAFLALACVMDADANFYPSDLCRCLLGLACMAIICGMAWTELEGRRVTGRGGAFVGGASYSIYLIHTLAIGLVAKLLMKAGLAKGGWDIAMLPVATAAVATGLVLFIVVERPLLRLARMRAPAVLEVS